MEYQIENFSDGSGNVSPQRGPIQPQIPNIDHLDFQFKKMIQGGCNDCRPVRGQEKSYVKKDPKLFEFII